MLSPILMNYYSEYSLNITLYLISFHTKMLVIHVTQM